MPLLDEHVFVVWRDPGGDFDKDYEGEEGVEVALAATVQDKDELLNESADLLYHLLVTLEASDLNLEQVLEVLQQRHR